MVSKNTVKEVNNCPRTKAGWKEAEARKNCSLYASQCDEPDKLKYHCVLNPLGTTLLEVCAYEQKILFG